MKNSTRTRLGLMAFVTAAALGLTACGGDADTTDNTTAPSATDATEATDSADDAQAGEGAGEVTDMAGNTVEIPADPQAIVATDNRIFHTLAAWDIDLVAAPVTLMPENDALSVYHEDSDLLDLGSHREPNMEVFVEAAPDLVLNGQRFSSMADEIKGLVGDAAFVDTNFDLENNTIDEQLRQVTTLLGDIFGKQDDAAQLIEDFDASIERAKEAYDADQTVMGLLTSGGTISFSAPSTGRAVGPVFDVLGLTPALELENESEDASHGDDISVEAIAESNPDWIIVLDRDAGTGSTEAGTAEELIEQSEALANVTAVKEDNIVYLDPDFYTAEDIQHYTGLFNDIADAFEAQN